MYFLPCPKEKKRVTFAQSWIGNNYYMKTQWSQPLSVPEALTSEELSLDFLTEGHLMELSIVGSPYQASNPPSSQLCQH